MEEVHIVGAGNAGCYLAQQLKKKGINFRIFEEHPEVGRPPHCTGLVSKNIDEFLDVSKDVVLNQIKGAKLFSPDETCLELTRDEDQAYVFDRVGFDKKLAEGLEITTGKRVEKLNPEAEFIVGADGPNSTVAELGNFPKLEKTITGIQVEIENESMSKDFVEMYFGEGVAPGFFAWIVPMNKRLKVGLASNESPGKYLGKFISEKFGNPEILEKYGGVIPMKWRREIWKDHIALVGDAAGQVKPTSGGGIYMGFKSAKILADALERKDLEAYEELWSMKVKPELNYALMIRKFLNRLTDKKMDKLWELLNKPEIKKLIEEHGDMDKPSKLIKEAVKNPVLLSYLPYFRYLF